MLLVEVLKLFRVGVSGARGLIVGTTNTYPVEHLNYNTTNILCICPALFDAGSDFAQLWSVLCSRLDDWVLALLVIKCFQNVALVNVGVELINVFDDLTRKALIQLKG